jgi:DNA invertase Pin-like site-specific DNA recombinase
MSGFPAVRKNGPNWTGFCTNAHRRYFDAVVVWRSDRFARSVSHLLKALENIRSLGIEFVSLSEQVDTSPPTGKMIFTVLGAVAELERSLIATALHTAARPGKPCLKNPSQGTAVSDSF